MPEELEVDFDLTDFMTETGLEVNDEELSDR